MEWLGRLFMIGLVLTGFWLVLRPRYVFVVRIKDGAPKVARGKVSAAFMQSIRETCGEDQVAQGWVGGVRRSRGIRLRFSYGFPIAGQQRLRNLWVLER